METLNIDYHKKKTILRALSIYQVNREACKALGVTERTLSEYRQVYGIKKQGKWFVCDSSPELSLPIRSE